MGYKKIKIIAPLVALVFVVGLFGLYSSLQKPMAIKTIQVGSTSVTVEIADTLVTQTQGLSGRDTLYPDQGMLFVYPEKALRNFWMKDMLIPLDALWIADGVVIGIEENIPYRLIEGEIPREVAQ